MKLKQHSKQALLVILSFFLLLQIEAQAPVIDDVGYRGGSIKGIKKLDRALNFVVIGDWGRNGENYQKEVATAMGQAAHDMEARFVISTGDNFYPYGVRSVSDYHWISSFETIYRAQSLHVKWHPVLGNHDYGSNPDAEVEYSKISSRWDMPARYYSKKYFINNDTTQGVLLVFIDTEPFEKKMQGKKTDSVKYTVSATADQQVWLEKTLSDATVKWKIVVGHHTVYTGGWRMKSPETQKLRAFLEPMFQKYGVDLYICGHEHHLEYTKPEGNTHYIVSGAGSEARTTTLHPEGGKFAASEQGFAAFSIAGNKALLQFINHTGKIIYTTEIDKK
ncbi:MAG: tartrate-resistant acid phosphatase type 5 family protein [Bacteroidota bacterium]